MEEIITHENHILERIIPTIPRIPDRENCMQRFGKRLIFVGLKLKISKNVESSIGKRDGDNKDPRKEEEVFQTIFRDYQIVEYLSSQSFVGGSFPSCLPPLPRSR